MPQTKTRDHRLDIQGLRALAVVLVVAFHLSPKTLPGGYIGVDVFFVISGYLITGHLLREVTRTGTVKLTEFWARRVRRLLPAAFLVLVVSALAVFLFLPSTARDQSFTEIGFASIYLLNWRLAADSVDYLAADNAASIAQHYWSLSVEEQFYIVWPILVILAVWIAGRLRRVQVKHAVAIALGIVFIASLAFSIIETARSQPSAYFITTTRAWEFAAGGLMSMVPLAKLRAPAHAAASWIALALVVASAFLFQADSPFPGWIALIPVAGTAILLWIGDSGSSWSPQYLAKSGPVQLIGDTSYAIYLWHWPLIITATAILGRSPGWIWGTAIALVTVGLSVATKYLVEDPVRKAPGFLRRRRSTFGLMAVGMAAILALTITPVTLHRSEVAQAQEAASQGVTDESGCFGAHAILNDCSGPYRNTASVDPDVAQSDTAGAYLGKDEHCRGEKIGGRVEYECRIDHGAATTVMLLGDSHAYSLYPAFTALAEQEGWNLGMHARSGCPGHGVASVGSSPDKVERCASWSAEVQQQIIADPDIDVVVFNAYEINYEGTEAETAALFTALRDAGKQVIVIRDVPGMETKEITGPTCVAEAGGADDPCTTQRADSYDWVTTAAAAVDAPTIDPREILCDDTTCHAVIGGTVVYQDSNHITVTFSRTLVPWLRERLEPLVG